MISIIITIHPDLDNFDLDHKKSFFGIPKTKRRSENNPPKSWKDTKTPPILDGCHQCVCIWEMSFQRRTWILSSFQNCDMVFCPSVFIMESWMQLMQNEICFVKHCKFGFFVPQWPLKFVQRHGYTPLPTPSNLYFASWKVEMPFNSINVGTGFTGFKPPKKCTQMPQMPDSAAGFQEIYTGIELLRH